MTVLYFFFCFFAKIFEPDIKVTIYDIFRWGTQSLLGILHHQNLTVIKGDVLDTPRYKALVQKHDVVIHLAAIVGYPACKKVTISFKIFLNQIIIYKKNIFFITNSIITN